MSSEPSYNKKDAKLLQLVLAGDLEGVRASLESGADVNATINGLTPLIVTAFSDEQGEKMVPVFQELMKHNADLEIKGTIGRNVPDMRALHFGCAGGRTALTRAMIEAGADVNALDGHGQTPLNRAMQNRHEEIIDCLLENGADATIASHRGATPLIQLADPIPAEEGAVQDWEKDARIARKIMKANVDVNALDDEGMTALHWAAKSGHVEMVSVLLKEGKANVNIQGSDGQTALFMAVVLLLSPSTPVSTKERLNQVIDVLVANDANENITDKSGNSPFNLAMKCGRPDVMKRMDRHIEEW